MTDDYGAKVNEWVDVVRRARLGRTVKAVAMVTASYANADGTRVFPGIARLAVQCEIDYRTAQRALAVLRKAGLIEVVRRGARRSGKADEYRLILAADLLERCHVPTPAAERVAIERMGEPRHRSTRHPRRVEPPVDNELYTAPLPSEPRSTRQGNPVLHGTGAVPPSMDSDREIQPPADDGQVSIPRTGSWGAPESNGTASPDTHSRDGTEFARQAAADALTEWVRAHPEAAT